jgi:Bifunctional DNA primase/polymerase, N-terminal/Primase C terminal 1 (PriCT-1)
MSEKLGSMLDAAKEYARSGIPILPLNHVIDGKCSCGSPRCDKPGKHPLAAAVPHGLKQASSDLELVTTWWTTWPDANIGGVLGEGVGLVLDVDPRNGGSDSLQELLQEHGRLPEGPTAATGGGGQHYWFAWPGGEVRKATGFRDGLDLQSTGSYVVLPPSNHASGRVYTWETPLGSLKLPMIPPWLLEAAEEGKKALRPPSTPQGGPIASGMRNATLTSIAGRLRRAGAGSESILAELRSANAARCQPPLPETELHAIARSVARYEPAGDPESVRSVPALDSNDGSSNPWAQRTGWAEEPALKIIMKEKTDREGNTEVVPVEEGYVIYNQLVEERFYRPFRTVGGELRIAIPTTHGLEISDPLDESFVDRIGYALFTTAGEPIPVRKLTVAQKALAGRASARSLPAERVVELWLRAAPAEGFSSLLDLADAQRRCISLKPEGWTIQQLGHPVFDQKRHMRALPEPVRSSKPEGDFERVGKLWRFVPLAASSDMPGDDPRLLALALLVQFLVAPASPKTVAVLTGEEGIGKSSAASRLEEVVDPSVTPLVKPPEDDDDLMTLAANHATINIDNISYISPELSDNLARLSTGISLPHRRLYSDGDEVIVSALPQIILNGITATPRMADLLRRCVFLNIIPPEAAIPRAQLAEEWARAHPEILGGLLDLACRTLGVLRDSPPPPESSSMADFVRVGQSMTRAMGRSREEFLSAWKVNVERQGVAAAEDPWVSVLHEYFGNVRAGEPTGRRPEDVVKWINESAAHAFPRGVTSVQLGVAISRAKKTLAKMGVIIGKSSAHGITTYRRLEAEENRHLTSKLDEWQNGGSTSTSSSGPLPEKVRPESGVAGNYREEVGGGAVQPPPDSGGGALNLHPTSSQPPPGQVDLSIPSTFPASGGGGGGDSTLAPGGEGGPAPAGRGDKDDVQPPSEESFYTGPPGQGSTRADALRRRLGPEA